MDGCFIDALIINLSSFFARVGFPFVNLIQCQGNVMWALFAKNTLFFLYLPFYRAEKLTK